jgi:hypothetical protein
MQQNLLNAEFASVEHRNAGDKNMHVLRVMKALTKVLHICLLPIALFGLIVFYPLFGCDL